MARDLSPCAKGGIQAKRIQGRGVRRKPLVWDRKGLETLAGSKMGEEEERSWKEEGLLLRGCNTQINGFGGRAFTGDNKVQSVIVEIGGGGRMDNRSLGKRPGIGGGQEPPPRELGPEGRGQSDFL